ncbi:MAG: 16S rRNA (guanine(527)-N(7))-methyltransferase RsmG [Thermoanaerobaculales bacterium]
MSVAAVGDAACAWDARLRGVGLAPELAGGLARFLALLAHWSTAVDLVASLETRALLGNVLAALAGLPWLLEEGKLLDVGSGNGFPAVPLLLARPRIEGVLLEPRERRWAFLREAVRELGLAAEVRRERLSAHAGSGYDFMTVRGVAAEVWLMDALRVLRPNGTVLWWTSVRNAEELRARVSEGRVLQCPLPNPATGTLALWQRCST